MDELRVEFLQEADRPALLQMLEASGDSSGSLLDLSRRRHPPYEDLVAWRGERIEGMLTGSFRADLAESGAFVSFELPPAPHALLTRVHVHASMRRQGVGQALIQTYASEVLNFGCTFIGGSIDLTSDPATRKAFFDGLGFMFGDPLYFGASPRDVLAKIANR